VSNLISLSSGRSGVNLVQLSYIAGNYGLCASPYLIHDGKTLGSFYPVSDLTSKGVFYEELYEFTANPLTDIIFKSLDKEFDLSGNEDTFLKLFMTDALVEFEQQQKMSYDSDTVRLEGFNVTGGTAEMIVRKCRYSHQVKTHLVLDWDNRHLRDAGFMSYRQYLTTKYGYRLPTLDTALLSNSIGISVILYFFKDGYLIPYLPLRSKTNCGNGKSKLSLCEGMYSSSASGSLEWKDGIFTMDYLKEEILREITEELGLVISDIKLLEPMALMREIMRAGKPQIFFIGFTDLTETELVAKREFAIRRNIDTEFAKVEIQNRHLSFPELLSGNYDGILSLEAQGILYYAEKYIRERIGITL